MKRILGPGSKGVRMLRDFPGYVQIKGRREGGAQQGLSGSARNSGPRIDGDRDPSARARGDPASSSLRAIGSAVAASSRNPRLPDGAWRSVGAVLRPGPAPGVGGAREPGRPASLRVGDRFAPLGAFLLRPSPVFSLVFPPPLFRPPRGVLCFSEVRFLRAPYAPPEQPGAASAALLGGDASSGRGRSVDTGGRAEGTHREKQRLSGARRKLPPRAAPLRPPPAPSEVLRLPGRSCRLCSRWREGARQGLL